MRARRIVRQAQSRLPWLRPHYRRLQFALDGLALAFAFFAAYAIRFDFAIDGRLVARMAPQLPFVVLVQLSALFLVGAHRRVWRYTSLSDLPVFLRAAFYSTSLVTLVRLLPLDSLAPLRVPISVILIDVLLAFGGVVALRAFRRYLDEHPRHQPAVGVADDAPVILVGAGRAGVLAIREIQSRQDTGIRPVAFVDDDPLKVDSIVAGVPVLGTTEDLPTLVEDLGVDRVVLTIAEMSTNTKRRLVEICERIPVKVQEVPGYFEVLQGSVSFTRFRDVKPEELLGRQPIQLEEAQLKRFIAGRRVLVTGAGGSIGSELCRQIGACGPERLVLVERAEHALFEIEGELRRDFEAVDCLNVLADCGNESRMRRVLAHVRPHLIVHAAAHKHVPMMESHPSEAVFNNVLATRTVGELAGEYGAEHFILVSTDKAVRPTSVMGASKRVAELVVQDLARRHATVYAAVRFGNVLGSAGSVIPIFRRQIEAGGPVTVTDPDMQRYFMSIPEAAQLVLRAGSLAKGGEIFALDMGKPVRILDLAQKMIRLSGYEPDVDIDIQITGKRRGEKLFEELGSDSEELTLTVHPKIYVGQLEPYQTDELRRGIEEMRRIALQQDGDAVREFLAAFLPESMLDLAASSHPVRSGD